jgi:hypothetical protein
MEGIPPMNNLVNNKGNTNLIDLGISDSTNIKTVSMSVVNALQNFRKGDQVVGLAVVWILVCERFDIKPIEIIPFANKLLHQTFDSKYNPEFSALKDYVHGEL